MNIEIKYVCKDISIPMRDRNYSIYDDSGDSALRKIVNANSDMFAYICEEEYDGYDTRITGYISPSRECDMNELYKAVVDHFKANMCDYEFDRASSNHFAEVSSNCYRASFVINIANFETCRLGDTLYSDIMLQPDIGSDANFKFMNLTSMNSKYHISDYAELHYGAFYYTINRAAYTDRYVYGMEGEIWLHKDLVPDFKAACMHHFGLSSSDLKFAETGRIGDCNHCKHNKDDCRGKSECYDYDDIAKDYICIGVSTYPVDFDFDPKSKATIARYKAHI